VMKDIKDRIIEWFKKKNCTQCVYYNAEMAKELFYKHFCGLYGMQLSGIKPCKYFLKKKDKVTDRDLNEIDKAEEEKK